MRRSCEVNSVHEDEIFMECFSDTDEEMEGIGGNTDNEYAHTASPTQLNAS